MALILNIETSTSICSVCLSQDGKLVDYREDRGGTSHAKLLTVFIDQLLKARHFLPQNLDAIAISSGPGSYTGLRIGTSVAKGLCYALDKPLIAIPTLLSLASGIEQEVNQSSPHNFIPSTRGKAPSGGGHNSRSSLPYYMPCLDARRMDIYTAIYQLSGALVMPVNAVTVDKQLEEMISGYGEIYIGGNATEKCRKIFTSSSIHCLDGIDCDSRLMVPYSEAKYARKEFEDTAYFEPFYLKDFGKKT